MIRRLKRMTKKRHSVKIWRCRSVYGGCLIYAGSLRGLTPSIWKEQSPELSAMSADK